MKAVTVKLDDSGLDGLLRRVKTAQQSGFDRFDLCIQNPQLPLGRIVNSLREGKVSLVALRLLEPRNDALVLRRPGYAKVGAKDPAIAARSAEMVAETALALAELRPQFLILDGGYVNVNRLHDKQLQLDELLDCEDNEATRKDATDRIIRLDKALVEEQLVNFCRGLHTVAKRVSPLKICLLPPDSPFGLLQPDAMKLVFAELKGLGFWHSTSNAALLHKLGGPRPQLWMEEFATRLQGVYLADMLGGHGEQPPGLGEIDFQKLAPELASNTVRVLVVDDDKGTKLRFGKDYLSKVGIF